jgi:pyruvate,water dikinase
VRERPELTLGKLAAALDAEPESALRRSDEFAATLRSEVPEEHRSMFDEVLSEARLVYRLRDERGVYSDISAIGLLRLAMMEVGRRAHAAGRLHEPEHVLDARMEEAVAILDGGGPDADELAARVGTRDEAAAAGAPRFLGPPPPEPPPVDQLPPPLARVMGSIGFTIVEGILGQLEQPEGDESTVIGIPAAGGVYEGPARLIHDLEDLLSLQAGDVLVAPTTGEAFNSMLHLVSAIVTDHGSYASHAGIIAREMGFPAVVGTVNGTTRIKSGDRVRVDGDSGEVTIVG